MVAAGAAAGLPRDRDAELPGSGGDDRGRPGHPALPADGGGRQVSLGGRGGPRGRGQGPQPGPAAAAFHGAGRSEHSGGFCVGLGWRPRSRSAMADGPPGPPVLRQRQFCQPFAVLLPPQFLSALPPTCQCLHQPRPCPQNFQTPSGLSKPRILPMPLRPLSAAQAFQDPLILSGYPQSFWAPPVMSFPGPPASPSLSQHPSPAVVLTALQSDPGLLALPPFVSTPIPVIPPSPS